MISKKLRCGVEGDGILSNDTPARFCFTIGAETFYFNNVRYDMDAVPGTILIAERKNSIYEFMRVSNGEYPKWRITSIKDMNGFHSDHGERAANNLFGKILSLDKNDTYYIPSQFPKYNGLMLGAYKSNVEKKVLEFLANLKNVETEDELRELVWEFKYGSSVREWIANPVESSEHGFLFNDSGETSIDELPQVSEIGTIIDLGENHFTLKTEAGRSHLFRYIERVSDSRIDEIEAKRGHFFYTLSHIGDTDKWRIVSKIREK